MKQEAAKWLVALLIVVGMISSLAISIKIIRHLTAPQPDRSNRVEMCYHYAAACITHKTAVAASIANQQDDLPAVEDQPEAPPAEQESPPVVPEGVSEAAEPAPEVASTAPAVVTKAKSVLLFYTGPNCRYCVAAEMFLAANQFAKDHSTVKKLKALPGMRSIPQSSVEGKGSLVGYIGPDKFLAWLKTQHYKKAEMR